MYVQTEYARRSIGMVKILKGYYTGFDMANKCTIAPGSFNTTGTTADLKRPQTKFYFSRCHAATSSFSYNMSYVEHITLSMNMPFGVQYIYHFIISWLSLKIRNVL